MRVLYHHRIASNDGQAVHIEEIIAALRARGHDVKVVGPSGLHAQQFGFEGGVVARLKRLVPHFAYELLEFSYNAIALVRILWAAWRWRPDFIYERYNLYFVAGLWASKLLRLPILLEVNAPLLEERSAYGGIRLHRLARWSERFAWRNADAVLAVTRVLADRIVAAGVSADRLHVVPNGIDLDKFGEIEPTERAQQRLGVDGHTVLGFTGFMRGWHGLNDLVTVVARSPDRFLLLVGDGPARSEVERRAEEAGVAARVRVTGIVPRAQVASHVAAFDVALQPEVVEYASPLKLFEYLAMGRAIVAPDRPNIREILTHEDNALLFAPGDAPAMIAAVERLCRDPALRERIGRRARATIAERDLTWSANAARIETLAGKLISARASGGRAWRRRAMHE
jgi:glycosyltransferase involved in cell wall biosynthesis